MITSEQTRPCDCGKLMVLETANIVLTTIPPQTPTLWRCYGCGSAISDGTKFLPMPETDRERWNRINGNETVAIQQMLGACGQPSTAGGAG